MTEERKRADQDSPWKEILEAYFPQAMQFFFPQTAALINWERPHEFLDKEFQQNHCWNLTPYSVRTT